MWKEILLKTWQAVAKKQMYLQSEIMRTTLEIKDKYQGKIANRKCLKVQGVNTIIVRAVIAIQSMVGNVRIMWWLWPSRSSNGSANALRSNPACITMSLKVLCVSLLWWKCHCGEICVIGSLDARVIVVVGLSLDAVWFVS